MEWNQSYGGSKTDGATNILQTTDGDFILTGWTKSGGAGGHDAQPADLTIGIRCQGRDVAALLADPGDVRDGPEVLLDI